MKTNSKLSSKNLLVFSVNLAILINLIHIFCMNISQFILTWRKTSGYTAFPDVTLVHKGHIMWLALHQSDHIKNYMKKGHQTYKERNKKHIATTRPEGRAGENDSLYEKIFQICRSYLTLPPLRVGGQGLHRCHLSSGGRRGDSMPLILSAASPVLRQKLLKARQN